MFADWEVAGSEDGEGLLGVAGFEGGVVGVGDLAGLAIELELAKGINGGTLWPPGDPRRQRHWRELGAEDRVEDVAERCDREGGTNQQRDQVSRLTAASSAASSLSVATIGVTELAATGAADFQRLRSALTMTAPAPSAMNGIV